MNVPILLLIAAVFLMPGGARAADEPPPSQSSQAPQAAPPEQQPPAQAAEPARESAQQAPQDPYIEVNKQAQERLRVLGFYDGPVNGDVGPNTQAAIAQFQLSVPLPASGSLDDATLAALGIQRQETASAGTSGAAQSEAAPREPAAAERRLGGSCDGLVGPEKDRCVQQGGTVEASANATSGASAPASPKGN